MTDVLKSPAEESSTMNSNYDEDDEETRDFYIYILSREHPTVLTPVPNPYKRSDRIKEANAELQCGSPTLSHRPGTRIRFSDTPTLHEYIKQEDVLCMLAEDCSSHKSDCPTTNHKSNNPLRNEQPVIKTRQMNGWSNEQDEENEDISNRLINKENTSEVEKITNKDDSNNNTLNYDNWIPVVASVVESKINNEITSHTDASVKIEENDTSSSVESSPDTKTLKYHEEHNLKTLPLRQVSKTNKTKNVNNENNVHDLNESNRSIPNTKDKTEEIRSTHSAVNSKIESSSLEEDMTRENCLTLNTIKKTPVINNAEDKLNYRPSSTERIRNYNKQANDTTPRESKQRTSIIMDKEEKVKTDVTKSNSRMTGGIKKSIYKSKIIVGKQDTTTELTNKPARSQSVKLNKNDVSKAQAPKSKDFENKNSVRIKSTRHSSIEIKDVNESSQGIGMNNGAETPSSEETNGTNLNESLKVNNLLLSPEEVKSTLEEIKERNRSKLVVLVPPFEQYKSYMNDNYSDSDDNESINLEEYFRKDHPRDDLTYLPDFELESDNELDNLCKENTSFCDLVNLYPEDLCRNKIESKMNTTMKKANNSTGSKDLTRSLESDELRRHRYKMMDNIKSSEQYGRLTQDSGEASSKCKQKCSQRPSTAPGGRKFCDCKWPRVKLPEYNGLRSEYGLSAEQLSERKRQRQEITRRTRERRQRKMDEEERRKMENERMFHEWLLKKRQQAKEQWLRNQRLRALRYSKQCITPNQSKAKFNQNKSNIPLAIRKKLHPGRNCFSLDEIINDVTEHDENKSYKIYLGLSIE